MACINTQSAGKYTCAHTQHRHERTRTSAHTATEAGTDVYRRALCLLFKQRHLHSTVVGRLQRQPHSTTLPNPRSFCAPLVPGFICLPPSCPTSP